MEGAPLTLAHDHARTAALHTQKGSLSAAREAHEHAAGDFANAQSMTDDKEALRILSLLQEHHQQLAKLLSTSTGSGGGRGDGSGGSNNNNSSSTAARSDPTGVDGREETSEKSPPSSQPATSTSNSPEKSGEQTSLAKKAAGSPLALRQPRRELSSSIANNLATARGRPGSQRRPAAAPINPELTPQHAGGRIVSRTSTSDRPFGTNQSQPAPSSKSSPQSAATAGGGVVLKGQPSSAAAALPPAGNDGFNTFFSSFENLFSKLSAPLAFAGLPLNTDQANQQQAELQQQNTDTKPSSSNKRSPSSPSSSSSSSRSRATADHDLAHLFSAPALAAIREDAGPALFGAHESFYVVPTSGGTRSYAGIVSGRQDGDAAGSGHADENEADDEFVDARESLGPPSPHSTRGGASAVLGGGSIGSVGSGSGGAGGRSKRSRREDREKRHSQKQQQQQQQQQQEQQIKSAGGKTMEELELENGALRQLLDTQSRRLQMWEASSQSQSLALAQSMRFSRPTNAHPPPAASADSGGGGGGAMSPAAIPTLSSEPSGNSKSTDSEPELRLRHLEEILRAEQAEKETLEHRNEKMARENEKLLGVLGRYREKWEMLKEGARARGRNKPSATGGEEGEGGHSSSSGGGGHGHDRPEATDAGRK